jgi:hypothetical protein
MLRSSGAKHQCASIACSSRNDENNAAPARDGINQQGDYHAGQQERSATEQLCTPSASTKGAECNARPEPEPSLADTPTGACGLAIQTFARVRRTGVGAGGYDTGRLRGSSTSRRPSPSRLNASTAAMMAAPGKKLIQGAVVRKVRPSLIMVPQLGVGGWVPRPR